MTDNIEREKFEAWALTEGYSIERYSIERLTLSGWYRYYDIQDAWEVWRARAALSAAPDAEQDRLDDGYISSTLISGGDSHSITLHYKTAQQAEFAHSCITSQIDAAQAKEVG